MRVSEAFTDAEIEQIRADLEREACWADNLAEDAVDRRFRAKVWTALVCGLAAFWIVIGAAIVGVVWL